VDISCLWQLRREHLLESGCCRSDLAGECRRAPIPDVGQFLGRLLAVPRNLTLGGGGRAGGSAIRYRGPANDCPHWRRTVATDPKRSMARGKCGRSTPLWTPHSPNFMQASELAPAWTCSGPSRLRASEPLAPQFGLIVFAASVMLVVLRN
jgi:hypothetical protein